MLEAKQAGFPLVWESTGYTVKIKKDRAEIVCLHDAAGFQVCQIRIDALPGGKEQGITLMQEVAVIVVTHGFNPYEVRNSILGHLNIPVPARSKQQKKALQLSAKRWSPRKQRVIKEPAGAEKPKDKKKPKKQEEATFETGFKRMNACVDLTGSPSKPPETEKPPQPLPEEPARQVPTGQATASGATSAPSTPPRRGGMDFCMSMDFDMTDIGAEF